MSNTKEVHSKPRLHVSLSTCYLEYGRHVARLHRRRSAYAPTSNTGSHDNHEKINSWVSFWFPYMGCIWVSAWRPFWPPELRYKCHLNDCCFRSLANTNVSWNVYKNNTKTIPLDENTNFKLAIVRFWTLRNHALCSTCDVIHLDANSYFW